MGYSPWGRKESGTPEQPSFSLLPQWFSGKESAGQAGALSLIPGLGRPPGEGHGYSLQYSCLENSMDKVAWQATVHGITKIWTRLSD